MNETQIMVLELGSKGYTCAQILIIGALRLMGKEGEESEPLVRAMSALAQGVGNSGQICGALSGGLCLLSMYSAKGNDYEQAMQEEALLMEALLTWFDKEVCVGCDNTCDSILGLTDLNADLKGTGNPSAPIRSMNQERCGSLIAKTWDKCLQLLQEYNINPSEGRN